MPCPLSLHRIALYLLALSLLGCGGEDEASSDEPLEREASPDPVEPPRLTVEPPRERFLPDTPLPQSAGLYAVQDDALVAMSSGDPDAMQPTNAERGFGFEHPQGHVFSAQKKPLWVLQSSVLELSTLRLTRYTPEALLPLEGWTEPLERGRFGWLPNAMVRLTVEPVEDRDGQVVRVQPMDPLAPGFYVLHDGAVTRAAVRKDIKLYYPFQVAEVATPEGEAAEAALWLEQVMPCTRDIERALLDSPRSERDRHLIGPDREGFTRVQGERLRRCAARLSTVLSSVTDTPAEEHARAALITLEALALGPRWADMPTLKEATDPRFSTAALLDFWLEVEALEIAQNLLQAIDDNNEDRIALLAPRLLTYYGDRTVLRQLQQDTDTLGARHRLLWVPFFLDARWERLDILSHHMGTPPKALSEAVLLIAAHRAQRLKRFEKRHPQSPLQPLVDAAIGNISPKVLVAAEGLDPARAPRSLTTLGAIHVIEGTPSPSDLRNIEDAFLSQRSAFKQCFRGLLRRQPDDAHGVFLAVIELQPDFPNGTMTARLARHNESRFESAPFGDTDFQTCLENSLPTLPTYYGTVSSAVGLPLAFNGDQKP